jgi:DtxR family Mn-dependent transcriptional regulator
MIHIAKTKKPLSESQENYLKQIYLLTEQGMSAATQALADRLQVASASVTVMVQKLQELEMVAYEPYKGVFLSEQGKTVAIELIRHHRLLESFLQKALGYGWEEVHDEAERLEHYISETFESKIAEWLGHPSFDPHGDPIPDAQLRFPTHASEISLASFLPGTQGLLSRVATQDKDELNLFLHLHLVPGVLVELVENTGDSLRLRTFPSPSSAPNQFLIPISLAERLFLIKETK